MVVTIPVANEDLRMRKNSNIKTSPEEKTLESLPPATATALVTGKDLLPHLSKLLGDPRYKAATDAQWRSLIMQRINSHNDAVKERLGTKGRYTLPTRVEGVEEDDDGRLYYAMIPSPRGDESARPQSKREQSAAASSSSLSSDFSNPEPTVHSLASTTFLTETEMLANETKSFSSKKASARDPYTHHRTQRRKERAAGRAAAVAALEGSNKGLSSTGVLGSSVCYSQQSGSTALSRTTKSKGGGPAIPQPRLTADEIFKQRVGRLRRYLAHQMRRRDEIMERVPTESSTVQSKDPSQTMTDTINRILEVFSNEMVSDDDEEEMEADGKASSRRTSYDAKGQKKRTQRFSMQAREFMNLGPRRGQVTSESATSNYETIMKILTQEDYDFTKPYVSPEQQAELVRSQSEGTLHEGPTGSAKGRRRSSRRRSTASNLSRHSSGGTISSSSESPSEENTEDDLANEDLDDYERKKRKERRRRARERRRLRRLRREAGEETASTESGECSSESDSLFALSSLKLNVGISPELVAQRRKRRLSKRKSWRSVEGAGGSISHERLNEESEDSDNIKGRRRGTGGSYASNSSNNANHYGVTYVSKAPITPISGSDRVGDEQRFAARLRLLNEREKAVAAGAGGHRTSFGEGRASRASKAGSSPGAGALSAPATPTGYAILGR